MKSGVRIMAMPPVPAQISDADLQKHSVPLAYDVENVFLAPAAYKHASEMGANARSEHDRALAGCLENAAVEMFAIRLRSVVHFLYSHVKVTKTKPDLSTEIKPLFPSQKGDITAISYHGDWDKSCTSCPQDLVEAKQRADKLVAHLTKFREAADSTDAEFRNHWEFGKLIDALRHDLLMFLTVANASKFDPSKLSRMRKFAEGVVQQSGPLPHQFTGKTSSESETTLVMSRPHPAGGT